MEALAAIAALEALVSGAHSLCVLTGSGISQESGIPTFRGPEGLWRKYRPEDLATAEAFTRDPVLVWEWYNWRREIIRRAEPNAAHRALVQFEAQFTSQQKGRFALLTQNVDGLHERVGSQNVIRLHGSIWHVRCLGCRKEERNETVPLQPIPPRCDCGAVLRPAVVWFGEPLPQAEWNHAARAAAACELFLVIGTSALVQPAASLPWLAKRSGAKVVEINPSRTPLSDIADLAIRGTAAETLGTLAARSEPWV